MTTRKMPPLFKNLLKKRGSKNQFHFNTFIPMENIQLQIEGNGRGYFVFKEGAERLGEMVFHIAGKNLTVIHTEVIPQAEGKGIARNLLDQMVAYARKNDLGVIALCPYVLAQFKRYPAQYSDIWQNKNYGNK